MADELQDLLQRIQKDGVDKAETEAKRIVAEAERKAGDIVRGAQGEAASIRKSAEADAAAFVERGQRSLEQAARDLVLLIGQSVSAAFAEFMLQKVSRALSPDFLKTMLASVVDAYFRSGARESRIEVLLEAEQQKALAAYLVGSFADEIRRGVTLKPVSGVVSGIRVRVVEENVEHDFTAEAITHALSELVRPYLADIVRRGAASKGLNVADKPRG